MSSIFITGTDTEVGKTFITLLLAQYLIEQGIDVGILKPISCGPKKDNDAVYLKKKLKLKDPLELINPYNLPLPLAPYANELHKKKKFRFNKNKIKTALKELEKKHDLVLVEGVGGTLVPITKNYLVVDLIKDLKLPTLIVARAGLGTLNHTLLTVEALKKRKIDIIGIVMNGFKGKLSEKTNPEIIEKLTKIKVIGTVKWQKK